MQSKPFFTGSVVGIGLGRFVFAAGALTALSAAAVAGPEGAQVVRGTATINQTGAVTTIRAGNNAIIDYSRFNVGTGETVRFIQPGATSRVLNRVTGGDPTRIDGSLLANGIVYISNPSGIFFGGRAIVSVGGLTAAAGTITNQDFLAGRDRFTGVTGSVVNRGTIRSAGSVNLVGQYVSNAGHIAVEEGTLTMTAGDEVYLGGREGGLMVRVSKETAAGDRAGVENSGTIRAKTSMLTAGDMYSLAIKNTGTITSKTVRLEGKGSGVVHVGGTIDARGGAEESGGNVTITGEKVGLFGATVDASGGTSGGRVRVGGSYQGLGDLRRADATYVSADSTIRADGGASGGAGKGGRVIVWSEDYTNFQGRISARGGATGGGGGFAEVSSRQVLSFRGSADLRAQRGATGTLLLDPNDLTIQAAGTTTSVTNTAGVFETTADSAILTTGDLVAQLALSDVTVQTADQVGSVQQGNITVADTITAPANANSLTLLAHNDIILNADIDFSASSGNVVLRADGVSANGVGRIDASGGGQVLMGTGGLAMTAGSGVGTLAAPVFTSGATSLAAASDTGGIFVRETTSAGLSIATVGGTSGLTSTTSGNIQVNNSAGSITIDQPISSAGQVLIQATDGVTFNADASSVGIFRVFADTNTDGTGTLGVATGVTITSGLEFTGDAADVALVGTGAITVSGATSNLLLRPSTPTLTIGLGGAAGNFALSAAELLNLAPGSTGQVDIGFATSVGGDATINTLSVPYSMVVRGDTVELAAAQMLTLSGVGRRLTLIGTDVDLNGTIVAGGNEVVLRPPSAGDAMDLGVGVPTANFVLTNADFNNITNASNVRIGLGASTGTGAVTVGTLNLLNGYTLEVRGGATTIDSLTSTAGVTFNASTGNVTVGSIDAGAASVSLTSVAGSILDDAPDNTADITTTGSVTLSAATAIGAGASTLDLDVGTVTSAAATSGGAFLSLLDGDSGGVTVASVNAGNTVLIDSPGLAAGAFTLTSITSGAGGVTVSNTGNLVLGTISASGQAASFTSSGGSVLDDGTQGTRVTAGTATFTATTGAVGASGTGDIDTDTSTSVSASSGAGGVFIREANALTIAALTTTGNGNASLVTDAGNITQSSAITVAGLTTLNAAAGNADVILSTAGNSFGTAGVQTTARDATIRGNGLVRLGTSSIGNDLTVTSDTGNIDDNGVATVGRAATFTTAANNATITLDQLSVSATGGGAGIALNTTGAAAHATIVNAIDTVLRTSSVGGNLSVTATTGNLTDSGTVTVAGNAAFTTAAANADINLDQLAVGATRTISVSTNGSNGDATIRNANALILGTSTVGRDFVVEALAGAITDSGISTVAGSMSLLANGAGGGVDVDLLRVGTSLVPTSILCNTSGDATIVNAFGVGFGGSIVGALTLTTTAGAITTTGTTNVGGMTMLTANGLGGAITMTGLNASMAVGLSTVGNATITNAQALDLKASTVGGNLVASATAGGVTDSGVVNVTGMATLVANGGGAVVNMDQLNVAGSVGVVTTGNAIVVNAQALDLKASTIGGNLTATATAGAITDSDAVSVGGMATLTANGAGGLINVDQFSLGVMGIALNTTGSATVATTGPLNLKASTIGGDLMATAGAGALTDSGAVNVSGMAMLSANGAGGSIDVDQVVAGSGIGVSTAGNATVAAAGSLALKASTVGGDLAATAANGTLTDTGTIAVSGNATLTAGGLAGSITMDQLAVAGTVAVNSTNDATIVDTGGLRLAPSTVGGNLFATATGGTLDDSGTVTVLGNASLTAGGLNSDIDADQLAVAGQVFLTAGQDARVINATALTLGAGAVGRDLVAIATTGNMTDGGTLSVARNAAFTTLASGATINLDQLAVGERIEVSTNGASGDATIVNASGILLGGASVGGNLSVTATLGSISDVAMIMPQGNASFTTLQPGGNITLTQTTMQANRTLSLTTASGGNASVMHSGALRMGASSIGGDLSLSSTGGIIQDAPISVVGATTLGSPGFLIDLSDAANDFGGAVSVTGASGVVLADANDLRLGAMASAGDVSLTAGGDLLDDLNASTRVQGDTVTLTAGGAMGDSNNRVQTQANRLVINGGSGFAFVGEADAVTLTAASGSNVNLLNQTGDLTIDTDIGGHYNLWLEALDGSIAINSNVTLGGDAGTPTGGSFSARAARNLTILGTINTSGFNPADAAGDIDLACGLATTTNAQFNVEIPTYLLTINGDLLAAGAGGDIFLNVWPGTPRAVTGTATILVNRINPMALPDAAGNLTTIFSGASVTMGQNEKLVALGNLALGSSVTPMAQATLGDVSVLGNLDIYAGTITILRRDRANILSRSQTGGLSSSQDLGTDIIAGGQINLQGAVGAGGTGGGGITFSDVDADVAGASGFDVRKYGTGSTQITRASFGLDAMNLPTKLDGIDVYLDLTAQGPGQTNIAEIIAGAVPKEKGGEVSQASGLDSGQKAKLEQMGIDPRELKDPRDLLATLVGRALYDDYPAFGASAPEAQRYQVTVNRLPSPVVEDVLRAYEAVYYKPVIDPDTGRQAVDPQSGRPLTTSRSSDIQQIFRAAYDRYGEVSQEFKPEEFRAYIETNPAETEAAQTLQQLRAFFDRVDRLGLGPRERSIVRGALLNYVKPQQLRGPGVMETIVFGSQGA